MLLIIDNIFNTIHLIKIDTLFIYKNLYGYNKLVAYLFEVLYYLLYYY